LDPRRAHLKTQQGTWATLWNRDRECGHDGRPDDGKS
jgi:hypothetical protein